MLLKAINADINKICRLCLYQAFETEMVSLSKMPDLIVKVKDCVALDIELNEKYPSLICLACLQQLNQWSAFREVCHQSHNILIQSVNNVLSQQEDKIPDEKDESQHSICKEQCDESDADSNYEAFEPDIEIDSPQDDDSSSSYELPTKRAKSSKKRKAILKTKIKKRKTQSRVKVKRKVLTRNKKPKVKVSESESESEEEVQDDSVEALEKYLYKLHQEDTEKELRQEITQIYNYKCDICHSTYTTMFEFLDHQETHNGQPVFRCHRCDQVFTSRSDLVDHDTRHQVPCPKCGKMILPGCMKTHLVLHTDKHKCSQCNWRFCNSTMLRQHVESVHIRLKTHVCETCGKSFTSTTSLQTHIKIHSDIRPYACKICEYSGRTASALYTHMARHENGLHVCEICAKSFKSFRSLRDHTRRVHSEKKNHECGFCQKKFVDKYMLTVHTRTHTGARPYQCTLCDRAFVRSDGLREHLATHGQRASYNCQQCGKKFIYRRSLGRHTCSAVLN